jgi:Protein of unknown function (DUF2937)
MLLARWLFHSIRLAAALGLALVAMQAPAVTREYQAALLQLVRSSDQEIAQRKASAQRFYGIASAEDEGRFLAQLRAVEPSNAETLAAALDRQRGLRASYDRIERSPDMLRPIIAAKDVTGDKGGPRRQIAETVFDSFAPQIDLSFAAAISASPAYSWVRLSVSCSRLPFCPGIVSHTEGEVDTAQTALGCEPH